MTTMRTAVALLAVLFATAAARADRAENHVRVDLIADTAAVQAGHPFTIGVRFRIDPGWHIYWTNPGDSGLATSVKVDVPLCTAGPAAFPVPTILKLPGGITNYGYEGEVVLLVPVTVPDRFPHAAPLPGSVKVTADARYLVCKDVCLPGRAALSMELKLDAPVSPGADADLIRRWQGRLPRSADDRVARRTTADLREPAGASSFVQTQVVYWKGEAPPDVAYVPPALDGWEIDGVTVDTAGRATTLRYTVTRNDPKVPEPAAIAGLMTYRGPDGQPVGDALTVPHQTRPVDAAPWGVPGK